MPATATLERVNASRSSAGLRYPRSKGVFKFGRETLHRLQGVRSRIAKIISRKESLDKSSMLCWIAGSRVSGNWKFQPATPGSKIGRIPDNRQSLQEA